MMSDPRTPKSYHVSEEEYDQQKNSLDKLRSKRDDLMTVLNSYKEKKNMPPAAKKIVNDEEDKAAQIRCQKRSKEFAEDFVDSVVGTHLESAEKLKEALDYKGFIRTNPYMRRTGAMVERQTFDGEGTD